MSSKSLPPLELVQQLRDIEERLESLSEEEVWKLHDAANALFRKTARLMLCGEFEHHHAQYLKSEQTAKSIIGKMMTSTGGNNAV